jgi:hypothetical protein
MRAFFTIETINQVPGIILNILLVRLIFSFNRALPNKIDHVMNREISLLVLLKNKIEEPDLFGLHSRRSFRDLTVTTMRKSMLASRESQPDEQPLEWNFTQR